METSARCKSSSPEDEILWWHVFRLQITNWRTRNHCYRTPVYLRRMIARAQSGHQDRELGTLHRFDRRAIVCGHYRCLSNFHQKLCAPRASSCQTYAKGSRVGVWRKTASCYGRPKGSSCNIASTTTHRLSLERSGHLGCRHLLHRDW